MVLYWKDVDEVTDEGKPRPYVKALTLDDRSCQLAPPLVVFTTTPEEPAAMHASADAHTTEYKFTLFPTSEDSPVYLPKTGVVVEPVASLE